MDSLENNLWRSTHLEGEEKLVPIEILDPDGKAYKSERYFFYEKIGIISKSAELIWDNEEERLFIGKRARENRDDHEMEKSEKERLIQEAYVLQVLNEKVDFLPKFHDLLNTSHGPMIIMEQISGVTLLEYTELTTREKVEVGIKVADMLKQLQDNGLAYYDLNLQNVIYDENTGDLTLLDLGGSLNLMSFGKKEISADEKIKVAETFGYFLNSLVWLQSNDGAPNQRNLYKMLAYFAESIIYNARGGYDREYQQIALSTGESPYNKEYWRDPKGSIEEIKTSLEGMNENIPDESLGERIVNGIDEIMTLR